ncbi:sugar ABC transporter substrate-binding protein [Spirochaeta africana]|uniref:ABC-type sugar transport system, periplasmic component n=1 Tax=Spirochaeta africana (strain ATCC 700263 / DSM 8902 / Z-7692) TaxID=889378 RepID=H9UG76_SPIAZ|nr:sugar ABC transporter substrate-binding protein [Spirochaeta africana]AFG36519.1 ABC-type sugar transport system, periplasmic component [Spirochaeta africana DSM 8902]
MRKLLIIGLSVVMMLALTGTVFARGQVEDGDMRIAYIARAQGDSFAAWLANAVVEEVETYDGVSVTVFDGQSRNELIADHIENAIVNQFDLILLQPLDSVAQVAPVREAIAAGLHVVTVNNMINDPTVPAIDADPIEQAAGNAELAVTQVPQNANVVVLMGPSGNMHSDQRRVGWQQYFFDERPDVTILDEQIAHWNKEEAMAIMEDWIQTYPQIDAVISMNDNMAAGAIEALIDAQGEENLPYVYGVDGTAEAALLIRDGLMTSTTLQSAYELAEVSVQLSYDILTGAVQVDYQTDREPVMIGAPLIIQDNAEEFIEMHRRAGNLR